MRGRGRGRGRRWISRRWWLRRWRLGPWSPSSRLSSRSSCGASELPDPAARQAGGFCDGGMGPAVLERRADLLVSEGSQAFCERYGVAVALLRVAEFVGGHAIRQLFPSSRLCAVFTAASAPITWV